VQLRSLPLQPSFDVFSSPLTTIFSETRDDIVEWLAILFLAHFLTRAFQSGLAVVRLIFSFSERYRF